MTGVRIYVEGGGDGAGGKAELRRGFNQFFDALVRELRRRNLKWKLVMCGSRDEAYRAFRDADRESEFLALLVDAEGPVVESIRSHLATRDKWDLTFARNNQLYLMTEVMETWLVADRGALSAYFGPKFGESTLPGRQDLEKVSKRKIVRSLEQASRPTQRGQYDKIGHASDLLERVDVEVVKEKCSQCRRIFDELNKVIVASERPGASRRGGKKKTGKGR